MTIVTANPNPVTRGEAYSLSGCEFEEVKGVDVFVNDIFRYSIGMINIGNGICLDNNYWAAPKEPGIYNIKLYQDAAHGRKHNLIAELTLTVV